MLTLERARELNDSQVTEHHLIIHARNVMYAMGAMADYFGEDREHWMAVGYLHDYDYEKYPDEHLQHTEKPWQRSLHHRRCMNLSSSKLLLRGPERFRKVP